MFPIKLYTCMLPNKSNLFLAVLTTPVCGSTLALQRYLVFQFSWTRSIAPVMKGHWPTAATHLGVIMIASIMRMSTSCVIPTLSGQHLYQVRRHRAVISTDVFLMWNCGWRCQSWKQWLYVARMLSINLYTCTCSPLSFHFVHKTYVDLSKSTTHLGTKFIYIRSVNPAFRRNHRIWI